MKRTYWRIERIRGKQINIWSTRANREQSDRELAALRRESPNCQWRQSKLVFDNNRRFKEEVVA